MTIPNKPTSPNQRYHLKDLEQALFAKEMNVTTRNAMNNVSRLIGSFNEDEKRIALGLQQKNK